MRRCLMLALLSGLLLASKAAPAQTVIIGGEESRGAELGNFVAVLALPEHIVVLERDAPFLRVFDLDGSLRQSVGRLGSGPGEYRAPTGLSRDPATGGVMVIDPSNARVTVYGFADSLGAPRFLKLENVGIRRLCHVGESLFGLDRNGRELLHELSIRDGHLVSLRRFGERVTRHPLGRHPLVMTRVSDGPLYCDGASGTAFIGSRMLGEVQEIDVRTGRQRTIPVPGFSGPSLSIVDEGTTLQQEVPAKGMDLVDNILGGPDGVLVVMGNWRRQDGGPPAPVSFEVAPLREASATVQPPQTSMPVGYTEKGAVCTRMDPVPTILLMNGLRCE